MLIVAVRTLATLGSKVTTKVVALLAATGEAGCVVTLKSAAFAPLTVTLGEPVRFRSTEPRFAMVKVRDTMPPVTAVEPKSVSSAMIGVESLLMIVMPLPLRLISGAGSGVQEERPPLVAT